ncbi:unnamed protein product, partial [Iphiclides podalirius]
MFQRPFSFGLLDDMLPKPHIEAFGSPQPYPYYPAYVFELPYTLKKQANKLDTQESSTYTEYTIETFDSRSFLPEKAFMQMRGISDVKTFISPMSLVSFSSDGLSLCTENNVLNYPRLTAPRDLNIPKPLQSLDIKAKVSFPVSNSECAVQEMFRANKNSLDIWEVATQVDKNVPEDIWDIVSKMPPVNERQIIATSTREVGLWQKLYREELPHLSVISEKQFIRHIMYLIIGVETSSFPFSEESNCFYMKENFVLEGISKEHLQGYVGDLLLVGTYYKRLYKFAFNQTIEDNFQSKGLVHEAAREVIRRYLLDFRLVATEVYGDSCKNISEELNCMPTLLQILHHIEPLKHEIKTIASIYKMIDSDPKATIPNGAELMSYLFNEISLVTHKTTARTLFNCLFSVCKVYFKFIERFIFEGELDDAHNEFFIRRDGQYVNSRSKRYWDKGFHITLSVAVPEFLRALAKFILLCGKSLRLLKLCNPSDPLVLLISSDHPSVKCCASFEELERQQQVLDVYRTRCLFVSGEPVTFDQILLNKEAERKAFTEMASLKQAETMEKIVAERKRLAQLIIAEKQHSLRVLEAAMAEAKAAKNKAKQRERKKNELEEELERATEEVDSRLKADERIKIMEYYSKLNMEVEKSKIHTEWKIKRLQLDQSRIQLLSTEERNLKREKLELEHKRNGENMEMSIESLDLKSGETDSRDTDIENETIEKDQASNVQTPDSTNSKAMSDDSDKSTNFTDNSNEILAPARAIAANEGGEGDNAKQLDRQGNVLNVDRENNRERRDFSTSSDVIGGKLDAEVDNRTFLGARDDALRNKLKVMYHEFGRTDDQNNELGPRNPSATLTPVDEENNEYTSEARRNKLKVLGTEFGLPVAEVREQPVPKTDAQREAMRNKLKVLGVEYNLPFEDVAKSRPANAAQEEAIRNRARVLGSEYDERLTKASPKFEAGKRAALTLDLKPFVDTPGSNLLAPNTGSVTPADLFPRLDLETPTTADIHMDGAATSDIFSAARPDKEYLSSQGFDFSIIVDESAVTDTGELAENSPGSSPRKANKSLDLKDRSNGYTFHNLMDGTYDFENFDPFGMRSFENYSEECFGKAVGDCPPYTHPAAIMEEVKKKPYNNIFVSNYIADEDVGSNVEGNNIATLTACLQRSVMLPLTYQLEVVNNSILTHFLVNLDMYEHLRSLKDYFFLMDGEFSRSICHNLFAKLTKTVNPQELLNFATLHNILDKALGSSISHVHKFSENLSFTITEPPLSFQHSSPDALQCLSLTYTVGWPLNIILSQEALLRYARVFQFLVKMRRVAWALGEDFQTLKLSAKVGRGRSRRLVRSPQYVSAQVFRHVMAALVRALEGYMAATCVQAAWLEFERALRKARTLDDLHECHVAYVKKVLFRCLLNNRSAPVMRLLNDIFTVVLKFSRVLRAGDWQQEAPDACFTHPNFAQLEELFRLFEKLAKYLHKVITKLMECGYQRHLVELLTMVNLNGYYDPDKSKEEQNSTMRSEQLPS